MKEYLGEQAQVDWKENIALYSKHNVKFIVNVLLVKLSFSRKCSLTLTLDKKQDTVIYGLIKSFIKFGGVPKQIIFDNMKTVIYEPNNRNRKYYSINEKFRQFAKDCNFSIYPCQAYRPETKGKVESLAKCIDELKVYNNEFEDLNELNEIVNKLEVQINHRVSTATGIEPDKLYFHAEQECLLKNPLKLRIANFYLNQTVERKVNNLGLVSYRNNSYSVPIDYAGFTVMVKNENDVISICYQDKVIAKHDLFNNNLKYRKKIDEAHLVQMYEKNNLFNRDANKIRSAARETLQALKILNSNGNK